MSDSLDRFLLLVFVLAAGMLGFGMLVCLFYYLVLVAYAIAQLAGVIVLILLTVSIGWAAWKTV